MEREIFNLQEMKRLGITGVAELLLTFTTFVDTQQHVHLIFNLYESDLETVLQCQIPESLPAAYRTVRSTNSGDPPLSRHPLWEAALGLLRTVASIHDPDHKLTGLPDGRTLQAAHLDLKPANAVVDSQGKLLLIDWEHAVLNVHGAEETSRFHARAGTPSYRPPEAEQPGETQLRRTYDVWSLGCILLEVMVCLVSLTASGDTVAAFRDARYREGVAGESTSALWKRTVTGLVLKILCG